MDSPPPVHAAPRSQAQRELLRLLEGGSLPPGSRLPTVNVLASHCRVARGTILAALAELEAQGRIDNRGHRGRFVPSRPAGAAARTALVLADFELPVEMPIDPGWDVWMDRGFSTALQRRGLLLLKAHASHLDQTSLAEILATPPFGVLARWEVVASADGARVLRACLAAGVPVAVNHADPSWAAADRVHSDWAAGTSQLVEFLAGRGCRRILRLWPEALDPAPPWLQMRDTGFAAATAALGLEAPPPVRIPGFERHPDDPAAYEQTARRMAGVLVDRLIGPDAPDALMCITDIDAIICATACRLCRREPGRDIHITGYDNYWRTCGETRFEPALPCATIDKRNDDVAEAMVAALAARHAGCTPGLTLIPPRLVRPG